MCKPTGLETRSGSRQTPLGVGSRRKGVAAARLRRSPTRGRSACQRQARSSRRKAGEVGNGFLAFVLKFEKIKRTKAKTKTKEKTNEESVLLRGLSPPEPPPAPWGQCCAMRPGYRNRPPPSYIPAVPPLFYPRHHVTTPTPLHPG